MRIAVIPARGGSKRVLGKNVRDFLGCPIIGRVINVLRESELFDRILVSTDDAQVAEIAKKYSAEVPFVRPGNLADDFAPTTSVLAHAVNWMDVNNWGVTSVCCVYPTAVLMQIDSLVHGRDQLESGDFEYVFSVATASGSYFRSFKLVDGGGVEMLFPDYIDYRSQDLPTAYFDAGQFYWGRPRVWKEERPIFTDKSYPIVVSQWSAQDIDSEDDWYRAEMFYKYQELFVRREHP